MLRREVEDDVAQPALRRRRAGVDGLDDGGERSDHVVCIITTATTTTATTTINRPAFNSRSKSGVRGVAQAADHEVIGSRMHGRVGKQLVADASIRRRGRGVAVQVDEVD